MVNKRALLIGISKYERVLDEEWDHLPGCTNDVELMKSLLLDLGFSDNDIVVLKNEKATHDAILAEIDNLIAKTLVKLVH